MARLAEARTLSSASDPHIARATIAVGKASLSVRPSAPRGAGDFPSMPISPASQSNLGAAFAPLANSWSRFSEHAVVERSAPVNSNAHWTGSEFIFWGGTISAGGTVAYSGEAYNRATGTWRFLSGSPYPCDLVEAFTTVWTGSEMILYGGVSGERRHQRLRRCIFVPTEHG